MSGDPSAVILLWNIRDIREAAHNRLEIRNSHTLASRASPDLECFGEARATAKPEVVQDSGKSPASAWTWTSIPAATGGKRFELAEIAI